MNNQKQVQKNHYEFKKYMSKERWVTLWHQLDEILLLKPERVLEIGPGQGLLKALAAVLNITIETLDLDPDLQPDHIASATDLPFCDKTYDLVSAFQVLEHLPYDLSLQAFGQMVRVSRRNVVISLPDTRALLDCRFIIPKLGPINFHVPFPRLMAFGHKFDGQHYWEINKRGYHLSRIITDFSKMAKLVKTYRIHGYPYNRIFVFETHTF